MTTTIISVRGLPQLVTLTWTWFEILRRTNSYCILMCFNRTEHWCNPCVIIPFQPSFHCPGFRNEFDRQQHTLFSDAFYAYIWAEVDSFHPNTSKYTQRIKTCYCLAFTLTHSVSRKYNHLLFHLGRNTATKKDTFNLKIENYNLMSIVRRV